MSYIFYEDPGHGWLRVPRAELAALGIERAITPYSYANEEHAYLEEDCDAVTFVAAKAGHCVSGWKEAYEKLDREAFARFWSENVVVNDRATLRGAPEIFIRGLPNYAPA